MKWRVLGLVLFVLMAGFVLLRSAEPEPVRLVGRGATYTVTVTLPKATTGVIAAEIAVRPRSAKTVSLSPAMPRMGHARPEINARRQRPGHFRATGEFFHMAGAWQLAVRVGGSDRTDLITLDVIVTGGHG